MGVLAALHECPGLSVSNELAVVLSDCVALKHLFGDEQALAGAGNLRWPGCHTVAVGVGVLRIAVDGAATDAGPAPLRAVLPTLLLAAEFTAGCPAALPAGGKPVTALVALHFVVFKDEIF